MNRKNFRGRFNKQYYVNHYNQKGHYPNNKTNFYPKKYDYEDQNEYHNEISVINTDSKNNAEVKEQNYEYDENKINEESQNQKFFEFNKIVGNTLIKFYEDHCSKNHE